MNKEIIQQSRVLIVDDTQANADLLERVLRQAGYTQFKSILDSRECVGEVRTFQPDIIVLDLMMPHLDGYAVMKQLRGWISDETYLPILVVTADISRSAKQKALSLGAKDFLTKPIDTAEATLRVYNLLETRWLYRYVQAKNKFLIEQVRESQLQLAAARTEVEQFSGSGVSTSRLNQARDFIAQAVTSVERIGEIAETIYAGQFLASDSTDEWGGRNPVGPGPLNKSACIG